MRLLLIRHAEPQANVAGIVAGPKGCTGLTERGRDQAEALAERLRTEATQVVDFLYASILQRAAETAEIIRPVLGASHVIRDCEFCELHPGECDGLTWEEQVRLYGPGDSRSPDEPISPGGESLRAFDQRVRGALERLMQNHPQDSVALVCHGGLISAAVLPPGHSGPGRGEHLLPQPWLYLDHRVDRRAEPAADIGALQRRCPPRRAD